MAEAERSARAGGHTSLASSRQLEVLRFISEHDLENGFGPSIREIGVNLGISSTNGVNGHLRALRRKGLLEPECGKARALVLTGKARGLLGIVEPLNVVEARNALVDLATELCCLTNGSAESLKYEGVPDAIANLWEANDAYQVALLRASR